MAAVSLLEGCRMLLSTITQIDDTESRMNNIERSFYSFIKENKLVEYKSVKSKIKFALDASIAFGAIFSLFLTFIGGSGLIYLIIYGAYYGYRLYTNFNKKQNNQILNILTVIMYIVSALVVVSMFLRSIVVGVVMAVLGVVSVLIATNLKNKMLTKENMKIHQENLALAEKNEQFSIQYNSLCNTYKELNDKLEIQAQGWMPEAYLNKDAMSFFVDCLLKRRADTIKELANLYEHELQVRREYEQRERHNREQLDIIEKENRLNREQAERHHQETNRLMHQHHREEIAALDNIASSLDMLTYEAYRLDRHFY